MLADSVPGGGTRNAGSLYSGTNPNSGEPHLHDLITSRRLHLQDHPAGDWGLGFIVGTRRDTFSLQYLSYPRFQAHLVFPSQHTASASNQARHQLPKLTFTTSRMASTSSQACLWALLLVNDSQDSKLRLTPELLPTHFKKRKEKKKAMQSPNPHHSKSQL